MEPRGGGKEIKQSGKRCHQDLWLNQWQISRRLHNEYQTTNTYPQVRPENHKTKPKKISWQSSCMKGVAFFGTSVCQMLVLVLLALAVSRLMGITRTDISIEAKSRTAEAAADPKMKSFPFDLGEYIVVVYDLFFVSSSSPLPNCTISPQVVRAQQRWITFLALLSLSLPPPILIASNISGSQGGGMIFTVGWVRQKRARGLNGDKEPSGWGSAEDIEQREYIYVYVHTYILKSCVCCTASCCSTHKRYISREGGDGGYRIQLILTRQPPKNPKAAATMTTGPHNRWQTHRKKGKKREKSRR